MEKYSEYKNILSSEFERIPIHWNLTSIGHLFKINAGGDAKPMLYAYEKDAEHPYPVFTNTLDVNQYYGFTSNAVFPGDSVTVTGRGAIGHAAYREFPFDAIVRLLVLVPKNRAIVLPKYYAYFIDNVLEFQSDSAAIGQLSAIQISPRKVCIPPLSEQTAIVAYLDAETAKMDKFVSQKEKEIDLLEKLKQRIIADAVTRGLDPNATLVPCDIPWIKQVPKGWKTLRLGSQFKEVTELNSDYEYKTAFKFNYGTVVPKNEIGDLDEYKETYVKYSKLKSGDIVINGLNLNYDFISQRIAIVPNDGIITSAYIAIRPRDGVYSEYFNYLFKTMDAKKMFHGMGTGIRLTLSYSELKKQFLPIPPLPEQQQIVAYIKAKSEKIDKLKAGLQQEIDKVKLFKQRLISDVVTGQVKVC